MAISDRFQQQVECLLEGSDIRLNGDRPWDIQVHDPRFYARVLAEGTMGLGESYMDGWWDCEAIDQFIDRVVQHRIKDKLRPSPQLIFNILASRVINRQSKDRAFKIGEAHYDLGNDLYQAMLDKRLVYTCGYWPNAKTLDEAQEAKLDLVCRKIGLKAGQRVLDIGCGWGSFAQFAAEKYQAKVVGITVSKEQVELARERCKGLDVEFRLQDYRDVNEKFDHIISLGMFEHVGYKNYRTYFEVAERCLKDDGLFLLHTIGGLKSVTSADPWIEKYIFTNSMLPSVAQIGAAIEGLFVMEDWHNFSTDYDKTIMAWYENVEGHWSELAEKYNERFHRTWRYYLLLCAGGFRGRHNQLWQVVLSKRGVRGGWQRVS
ncbi:cyclopropane fatty acyl phospholipid synthase [Patescibacteria group bacterium]|nr:cyclopropane fatty acyl phospholipid synthase [Patescibacteria group bacterium]